MRDKISTVLFWALILICVVALSRMTWQDWRGSLRTAIFLVPLVLFVKWFQSRFKESKRRVAAIMVYSALGAVLTGSLLYWDCTLLRNGYLDRSDVPGAWVSGGIFLVCCSAVVWSLVRLCRSTDKLPT